VLLEGSNQLHFDGDVTLGGITWQVFGSSALSGASAVTIAEGAIVVIDHTTTFPGSMNVQGALTIQNASTTFTISGTLTLEATGIIANPGTIRAGAFVDNGGTIVGNAPVLLGPPGPLAFTGILFSDERVPAGGASMTGGTLSDTSVVLKWRGPAARQFQVQSSSDLRTWSSETVLIVESSPGFFEARVNASRIGRRFFRVVCQDCAGN
jgi:hypothetical protein